LVWRGGKSRLIGALGLGVSPSLMVLDSLDQQMPRHGERMAGGRWFLVSTAGWSKRPNVKWKKGASGQFLRAGDTVS